MMDSKWEDDSRPGALLNDAGAGTVSCDAILLPREWRRSAFASAKPLVLVCCQDGGHACCQWRVACRASAHGQTVVCPGTDTGAQP